jgi:hypothetical protein
MKKRFLSLLLCFVLAVGLLPTVAFATEGSATDKTIMLGTNGISDPVKTTVDNKGDYWTPSDYVYFGVNSGNSSAPIKWRVLDADTANDGKTSGMFLLSEYLLASGVKFNKDKSDGNGYQGSDAQTWCSTFATNTGNFSTAEQGAMLGVTKTDSAERNLYTIPCDKSSLTANDKLFFLSVRELADYVGNYDRAPGLVATNTAQSAGVWWLRSPDARHTSGAGVVFDVGYVTDYFVDRARAARPAFNLNLNSVLFTSAAVGGKSASSMGNGLTAIDDYTGNEWKLTLKDYDDDPATNLGHDGFVATTTAVDTTTAGGDVSITYTGAAVGEHEYVSAMLVDSSDNVLYYGRLKNIDKDADAEGTVTVAIPSGLAVGTYTLKVFSEQCNGDYKTDYASAFQTVVKITPTLTLSANSGTVYSNAGTTSFTYTYDGDGTVSAVSSDEKVAAVSVDTENKTITATILKAGKATITVSAAEGTNYTAAEEQKYDLMVKQYVVPSYDDDEPTYSITVNEAEHGTVTSNRRYAERGDRVTLTVTPDKGWTLETLTVTDQNGKEIDLDIVESGEKYTFKMPSMKVTVTATFMEDNTMLNYFVDVNAQDYFYDAVLWAAENGVTYGVDDSHFAPNEPCTRAQIVTFLWRAAGSPEPKSLNSFTDVAADSYYAKAVAWAVEKGITYGTGDGKFSPNATCTRAQAVTFLYRAAGSPAVNGYAEFDDVMTDAYYARAVAWATEQGVTEGVGSHRFAPDNTCTRGQIVTFLWRSQAD